MRGRLVVIASVVALAAVMPCAALAAPRDTTIRTIVDRDGDNLLEFGPGDEYCTFQDSPQCPIARLTGPQPRSILNFLQLSDFQTVDEESPLRFEYLDTSQRGFLQPFSAAYRPQESLSAQVVEAMVRQARNTTSPVTGRPLDLTILTGDNADSQQFNETRWFIDVLDGHTKVVPDSGRPDLNPACDQSPGTRYDGVRDSGSGGYYEPDGSQGDKEDGDGYSPNRRENQARTLDPIRGDVTVRDFPNLFEAAQAPFEAVGLDMPWYTAFGNHDALIQGNSPEAYAGPRDDAGSTEVPDPAAQAIATGCAKVRQPSTATAATIAAGGQALATALAGGDLEGANQALSGIQGAAFDQAACAAQNPQPAGCLTGGATMTVPADDRRCLLAKSDNVDAFGAPVDLPEGSPEPPGPCNGRSWIEQHFQTTGTPVGHGMAPALTADQREACQDDPASQACQDAVDAAEVGYGRPPEAVANHDGYYSFSPKPGLRFVVLDTITDECGLEVCSEGSVDDRQFQWLRRQIEAAGAMGQYVITFSHHTLRTTRQPIVPPGSTAEQGVHYGERVDRRGNQPQNPAGGDTLEDLYCNNPYRNVLAQVVGHEHESYVQHHRCAADPPSGATGTGDFYEISTASHMDYPQQARMIELLGAPGEPMSLVLTILDHDGPPYPGGPVTCRDPQTSSDPACDVTRGQAGEQPLRLASISRELAYNDYQGSRAAGGGKSDRNVIVPLDRPAPPGFPDPQP